MIDRIQGIIEQYGTPKIKEVLRQKAAEAEKVAVERTSQASEVVRSEVTYTKEALVAEARKEIQAFYVSLLGRQLSRAEEKAAQNLAEVIAKEV